MREYVKRKTALFLAVLLVLPTILNVIPARPVYGASTAQEVLAGIKLKNVKDDLTVEVGQQFYLGDQYCLCGLKGFFAKQYTPLCSGSAVIMASAFSLSCSSSNKKVATVNKSSGLVTPKKAGTATLKMKIAKRGPVTFNLKVVKAGTLGTTTTYKDLASFAAKKLTVTNVRTLQKNLASFRKKLDKYNSKQGDDFAKMLNRAGYLGGSAGWAMTEDLQIPMAGRYAYYQTYYNPLSYYAANSIAANCIPKKMTASVKDGTIKVTLKKAVTKEMISWMEAFETSYKTGSAGSVYYSSPSYGLSVNDTSYNEGSYMFYAKFTAGSKVVTLYPIISSWTSNGNTVKKLKLKAGDKIAFTERYGKTLGLDKVKAVKAK